MSAMATIVQSTFSEPTRAETISTQILWKDSKPRSEGGRAERWERERERGRLREEEEDHA